MTRKEQEKGGGETQGEWKAGDARAPAKKIHDKSFRVALLWRACFGGRVDDENKERQKRGETGKQLGLREGRAEATFGSCGIGPHGAAPAGTLKC